jgi:hypothetical protein
MSKKSSSQACTKSELDLLITPHTQTAVIDGKWSVIGHNGNLDGDGVVQFVVPGDGELYYDLANSFLYFQVQIFDKKTKGPITENAVCAPVNLFLHSMFGQVDIYLNGTQITQSSNTYPYRAMFETLLNYSEDSKNSFLTGAMYYKDTPGKMESISKDNTGWEKRRIISEGGKIFEIMGRLHADIFHQDRFLLNNVPFVIQLKRSSPSFCLMSSDTNTEYGIQIHKASLWLRQITVNPDVLIGHAMALQQTNAKYPIKKVEMNFININPGVADFQAQIAVGPIPLRVVFGMVESSSYNGMLNKNPFNFQSFGVKSVSLSLNGTKIPYEELKLNPDAGQTLMGYYSLFTGVDKFHEGNNITREDYPNGYTLFAFDLTSDLCSGEHLDLTKKGNLSINLGFASALKVNVNIVIYTEYQQVIEIDKNRKVILDFSN